MREERLRCQSSGARGEGRSRACGLAGAALPPEVAEEAQQVEDPRAITVARKMIDLAVFFTLSDRDWLVSHLPPDPVSSSLSALDFSLAHLAEHGLRGPRWTTSHHDVDVLDMMLPLPLTRREVFTMVRSLGDAGVLEAHPAGLMLSRWRTRLLRERSGRRGPQSAVEEEDLRSAPVSFVVRAVQPGPVQYGPDKGTKSRPQDHDLPGPLWVGPMRPHKLHLTKMDRDWIVERQEPQSTWIDRLIKLTFLRLRHGQERTPLRTFVVMTDEVFSFLRHLEWRHRSSLTHPVACKFLAWRGALVREAARG